MSITRHPVLASGLFFGGVFFAHAMVEGSHAWPFLWPLLGGALAVLLAARQHVVRWTEGLKLGLQTGLVALLFVVFIGTPILYLYAGDVVENNWAGRLPFEGVLLIATIMAALGLANTVLALLGGLIAVPLFGKRVSAA